MFRQNRKAARRHRPTKEKAGAPTLSSTVKCILWAFPVTVGVGLLLLFGATALLLLTKDPDRYHSAVGLLLVYLTVCIGGAVATAFCRRRFPLLCGGGTALLWVLLLTVLSFCVPREWRQDTAWSIALLQRLLLLPAALTGGWLTARRSRRRRR